MFLFEYPIYENTEFEIIRKKDKHLVYYYEFRKKLIRIKRENKIYSC